MHKLLISMAVLVGATGLAACSTSTFIPVQKYSSAEAAALVSEKLSERVTLMNDPCLTTLPSYLSGKWIPLEKAHLLRFGEDAFSIVEIKYFETIDTALLMAKSDRSLIGDCF